MKVKIVSERIVAEVGSEYTAKRRVVVSRKTRTHKHMDKDGNTYFKSETDDYREVRVGGLPFVAKVNDCGYGDDNNAVKVVETGLDKIRKDLQDSLLEMNEILGD